MLFVNVPETGMADADAADSLFVDPGEIDVGEVWFGETIEFDVRFTNVGSRAITVWDLRSLGCGNAAKLPVTCIAEVPAASTVIHRVQYRPRRVGAVNVQIEFAAVWSSDG